MSASGRKLTVCFRPEAVEGVIPIFNQYFSGMQELVRELCGARKVEGRRMKELHGSGFPVKQTDIWR